MMSIQYVTDEKGNRIAVQIPLDQWEVIQAELELYSADGETSEIMAEPDLLESIKRGRKQAGERIGRRIDEIDI